MKQKNELAFMVDATTDDQGRWRSRSFRAMKFAYLYLSHPDFVRDGEGRPRRHGRPTPTDEPRPDEKPMDALRDFSDVQVMTRGVEVAGEVRDQAGQPVPGARVVWFEAERQNTMGDELSSMATDDQGRFRFAHSRPGSLMLQATADGFAPEMVPFEAAAGAGPATVVLAPAGELTGQVVDQAGAPVAEARVSLGIWRGRQTLLLRTESGPDGRFRLEGTPTDSFTVQIYKQGYTSNDSYPRVTPGDEVRLTLHRVFTITGSIRDASTRKRINEARVEVGVIDPANGSLRWGDRPRVGAFQGQYNAEIDIERMPEARLRFLAPSYKPHESRLFKADEGSVTYEVALEPEDPVDQEILSGIVRRPDGSPLADAEVALAYPIGSGTGQIPSARIKEGRFDPEIPFIKTTTDADGRFRIAREPDAAARFFAVVVVHPDFFARVDHTAFADDPTIVARPWGRIEGVARRGSRPLPGAPIRYYSGDGLANQDRPYLQGSGEATADDQGRFIFDHVMPGDVQILFDNLRNKTAPREGFRNGVLVDVEPGQTSRVEIGGTGRPVVATIELPAGFNPEADYRAHSRFSLESDRPRIPYPAEVWRNNTVSEWSWQWWNSPEGRAYRRSYYTLTQAPLQPDGTLRVDDVPPGDYRLNLSYTAEPLQGVYTQPERVAYATVQFTIPEIPGGRTDEPFDLGILRPKVRKPLTPNAPAPPFDVELLDGGRATLDDFKGKFLVLHFWSTTNRASLAELAELKDFHARYADDDRVALLSLGVAPDAQALRDLATREGLSWPMSLADPKHEDGILDAYHFDTAPEFKLINPDGTLRPYAAKLITVESILSEEFKKP